jgi:two-component system, LytTR family, response regulator
VSAAPSLIRAVIVDDEPLARERVRTLLATHPEIEVIAECADGEAAIEVIESERPDLIFLDVQMPGVDGFGVLGSLGGEPLPAVVFVTAHDEYALRAFDVNAVDYLLKPFDRARFETALTRAMTQLTHRELDGGAAMRGLLAQLRRDRPTAARLVVRHDGKLSFVRPGDVDWIDAAGNYARLHVAGRALLMRETMKSLEHRLDPDVFVRVHRSAIVNVDRIATVEPYFHGEYVVTMRDGTKLTSSRTHSAKLRALLRG